MQIEIAQLMLTKCKFMIVLCDVFGGFEVLGSASVFNLFVLTEYLKVCGIFI